MLVFYDTARRQKVEFKSLNAGKVKVYSCGPTVYDHAHIGNFRSFMLADLLKRYLQYCGYEVFHVMNITDIEDKILRRVREERIGLYELTDRYTQVFFDDLEALNIQKADLYPRATAHVDEMIELIEQLLDNGFAYQRDGSVYFSIEKSKDYGRFAGLDFKGMQTGTRVDLDEYDKDDARDFVLWKAWIETDGEVVWDSPFGRGRPGWHLECSCMSMKYLGETFDLHTGGIDLVFPHHQNEIAQSEGATGKPFARYWMHNAFLNINHEKMSKSAGNFYKLTDIAKGPEDYRAYRLLLIKNHYRTEMNFTFDMLDEAKSNLRRFRRLLDKLAQIKGEDSGLETWTERIDRVRADFQTHMDDDLNTPRAMAELFGLVDETEKAINQGQIGIQIAQLVMDFFAQIDQVLGVFYQLKDETEKPKELLPELAQMLAQRIQARQDKDWGRSDELRDVLAAQGVQVKDTKDGVEWSWSD
jgi:cysteinyl-tRNA synthetase